MDKYEYKLKLEQLKSLSAAEDYSAAADIAASINWAKVRNPNTLCMVSDIFSENKQYEDCREILLLAHEITPTGKSILRRLVQNAISMKNLEEARDFYDRYDELAPQSAAGYELAYQIACLSGASLEEKIDILKNYKEKEYSEKWAYELAALYGQAGMRDECVQSCDDLILWFGDGRYVEKALDLKRQFQPLTPAQEEKLEEIGKKTKTVEIDVPVSSADDPDVEALSIKLSASKFNTVNLQEELAKNMQQILGATEKETVDETMEGIKKIITDIPYLNVESADSLVSGEPGINEKVDEKIKHDFEKLLSEENDGQMTMPLPDDAGEEQIEGQLSIEDVLAEWEKTKRAAEAAIAAAEKEKLELSKEKALQEAGEIMERLKALLPLLSAVPGEDLPEDDGTVASALAADAKEIAKAKEAGQEEEKTAETASGGETSYAKAMAEKEPEDGQKETISEEELPDEEKASVQTEPEDGQKETDKETEPEAKPIEETGAKEETSEPDEVESVIAQIEDDIPDIRSILSETKDEDMAQADETAPDVGGIEEGLEQILSEAAANTEEAQEEKEEDILPQIEAPEDVLLEEEYEGPRELTDEQKELFSYFLPVPGMEEQIKQVMLGARKRIANSITSLSGNIVIQGAEGSGKTVLATSLIKAIQKEIGDEDSKIGKISAKSLNRRDFAALLPKIAGGYLIVEKAGDLDEKTAARMSQIMENNTKGLVVILEDTKEGIEKALSLNFGFTNKFTEKINIPIFTIDELVDFGKSYAAEMECVIDEMGILALYNRINNIKKIERATTLAEVKDIIDQAIAHAEGGGIKKFFAKRYDDDDYLILKESDFEN